MKDQFVYNLPECWAGVANIFEALGSPIRQKILLVFEREEELTIKDIADVFPYSRTSIQFHLGVLEKAGLLLRRKEGREVLFHVNKSPLLKALEQVSHYVKEEV